MNMQRIGLLALLSVAATVMLASTAHASFFTAESYPTTVTGQPEGTDNYFELGGIKAECQIASFHGALTGASSTLTITPHYTECPSGSFILTLDLNGCDYLLHAGEGEPGDDSYDAALEITCPEGQEMQVTVFGDPCSFHIPPQTISEGIQITNLTGSSPSDITLDIQVAMKGTGTGTFLCPSSVKNSKSVVYISKVTLQGEQVGILAST